MPVTGEIVVGPDCTSFHDAVAHVSLQDISRADAAAREICTTSVPGLNHVEGVEDRFAFALQGEPDDPRGSFNIRVHISRQGDTEVKVGDLVSTENIMVDPENPNRPLRVKVRQVT